ncbi:hypothetical protein LJC52_01050 [Bacteroidales bacterium OttesenSCG-928-A17]|nr:hypothetical protein [Bacteroidales bacterium OttesenSCG-928-A17]
MYKAKQLLLAIILVIIPITSFSQNTTNSPYSRYGYGKLSEKAFAAQRGMGGIGLGVRNSKIINPMNPASYSNVDSMTFMIDMGIMGQMGWLEEGNESDKKANGGLEYLAMQFPLSKKVGMGIGLEPISHVGYGYGRYEYLSDEESYATVSHTGDGGLSQVYASLSYDFFDRISVGAKFGYLFGDIKHDNTSALSPTGTHIASWRDTLRISGISYNLGIQYHQPIGKDKYFVVGAVYTPKTKVSGNYKAADLRMTSSGSTISSDYFSSKDSIYEMPESYGIGISYNKINKYMVGFDALYEKWSEAKFHDTTDQLKDRMKFSLGGEFIPDAFSRNYFKQIRYRAGLNYADSYIKAEYNNSPKEHEYKEYGASFGLGFPTVDKRSMVNISFDYSLLSPDTNGMTKEQYFKITLSYTFNELWFFKRKVQ